MRPIWQDKNRATAYRRRYAIAYNRPCATALRRPALYFTEIYCYRLYCNLLYITFKLQGVTKNQGIFNNLKFQLPVKGLDRSKNH